MHTCPAPPCTAQVPKTRLACPKHWFALPTHLQRAVLAGHRAGPLSDEHTDAMVAAIDWYDRNVKS